MTLEIREQAAIGLRDELIAHLSLIGAIFAWGSAFVATKYIIDDVPPMSLALLRTGIAAAALAGLTLARGIGLRVSGRDLRLLILLGAVGVSYFYIGLNLGLDRVTATNASLLLLPFPALTAFGAWLVLREPLGVKRVAGILIALLGALFMTITMATGEAGGSLVGNLLVVSTTLTWAAYTIAGRVYFPRWRVEVSTSWILLGGTIVLIPPALIEIALGHYPRLGLGTLLIVIYIAVACTAAPYLLWNRGVETVEAARASVYNYLQPVVVVLLAFSILNERPTWESLAGAALAITGTYIVARR